MGRDSGIMRLTGMAAEPELPADRLAWREGGLVAALLIVVALVGWLDFLIGKNLSLYPLYIPPIALAAWWVGAGAGMIVALGSVAAWVISHGLAGQESPMTVWVANATAHLAAFSTVIALLSSLRRSHAKERRLARTDPLTGLANPRAFFELASIEIERQLRFPRPLTIAFIDLDTFKLVNDRFGHLAGNKVLFAVARVLGESTRAIDKLARLGGDEFAVLMPETDEQGGRVVLERVQAAVAREMGQGGWPVSCSIGAVVFREPPRDVDELIGRADAVMYKVKKTSKNAIRIEGFPSEAADSTLLQAEGQRGE